MNVCIADKLRYCLKKRVTIIHTAVGKHSLPVCASYHDRILFSGLQSFRIGVFEIGGISFTLNWSTGSQIEFQQKRIENDHAMNHYGQCTHLSSGLAGMNIQLVQIIISANLLQLAGTWYQEEGYQLLLGTDQLIVTTLMSALALLLPPSAICFGNLGFLISLNNYTGSLSNMPRLRIPVDYQYGSHAFAHYTASSLIWTSNGTS